MLTCEPCHCYRHIAHIFKNVASLYDLVFLDFLVQQQFQLLEFFDKDWIDNSRSGRKFINLIFEFFECVFCGLAEKRENS